MPDYQVILHEPHSKLLRSGGLELLDEWSKHPDAWIWLNISGPPDDAETALLSERFSLPALAIQDAQRERHSPKIEVFDHSIFIILRDVIEDQENSNLKVSSLSLLMAENFLVSRHFNPVPAIEAVFNMVQEKPEILGSGATHVAYLVCRRISDNYTALVLDLEERLADLEDKVFDRHGDDTIELITRYNRFFKQLRRHLANQRDVVVQLHRPAGPLPLKLNRHEFKDVLDHFERLTSLCHLNQELASDLLNTHLNLVSHRLNNVMRILTIATVIGLPLTLLAGIYGMNFQYIPELSWRYGYFGALGIMAVIVIALVTVFKRKDWL